VMAVSAVVGVVLGAWYMLWAVERVFFGASREPPRGAGHAPHDHSAAAHGAVGPHDAGGHGGHASHGHGAPQVAADLDLHWYETAALVPLAVFVLWIGLMPDTFLKPTAGAVRAAARPSADAFAARMESLTVPLPGNPATDTLTARVVPLP